MQYAFHREELEANLVVGESGYRGICNLDNDINPIWRRENFRVGDVQEPLELLRKNDDSWDRSTQSLEMKYYERIEPGLRLASHLLQQSGPFFSHVLHGFPEPRQVRRLHPVGEVDQWRNRLVEVIDSSLTYFPTNDSDDGSWGEIQTALNERCRYLVDIGSILAKVICKPVWHEISAQTRRYYNFQLATTLVHELAHQAWLCRRWDDLVKNPKRAYGGEEAILSLDEEQMELGQSWENWFFGCELTPIEGEDTSPPKWLGFSCAPFTRDTGNPESIHYRNSSGATAVEARCINQFFQKERWAAHTDRGEPFSIHLTPLNSLSAEEWHDDLEDGFMTRMTLNHQNPIDPEPSFADAT